MKEEGLLYDPKTSRFLHVYRDNLQLIIDKEPCGHEHPIVSFGFAW